VPQVALRGTLRRLERPARAEGFDALFALRLTERGFEQSELAE
jgi:hypothetical protein